MPITVTMLQTRQGEGGVQWTAGNSYSASDAFAAYLISSNLATGTLPQPPVTSLSPADATAVQALVAGQGNGMAVSMGVLGQSLPFGVVLEPDREGVSQKVYLSAPNQNYYEPDPYAPGGSGGYFVPAIQQLGVEGIRVFMTNHALGGISLINDVCGVLNVSGWVANRAYRGKRTTLGTGDPGTKGEFILESGRIWECTTGNTHLAFLNSQTPVTVAGVPWRQNLTTIAKNTDRTTANAKPTFSGSAAVNDTVTDNGTGATGGGVVWTCIAVSAPAADASGLRVARNADLYWDPYGFALRARDAIVVQPVGVHNRYLVLVGTVQSDAAASSTLIRLAHQLITTYMAADSVKTIHTSCIYYPTVGQSNYDNYETVLSGGGLAAAEAYASSALTTNLQSNGYTLGIPGVNTRALASTFYYMKSLYRHFGTDVLSMLQTPQPNPHVTARGAIMCGLAHVPALRAIFRNEAQIDD